MSESRSDYMDATGNFEKSIYRSGKQIQIAFDNFRNKKVVLMLSR